MLVSEDEQVEEQAQKVRDQLESSFADAAARGHVVAAAARPRAFVDVGRPRAARRRRSRLEELAVDEPTDPQPGSGFRPACPMPAGDGVPRPGQRLDRRHAAGARARRDACCSSPAATAAPSGRSRSCRNTRSSPCQSNARRTRTRRRCSSPSVRCRAASGLPTRRLQVYAETDVFEEERHAPEKRRNLAKTFLSDLRDLKVGDLVVHVDHGIGEFVGLKQLDRLSGADWSGRRRDVQEFLELRYHGDDKLFVPVERLDLIQKYTGGTRPALDRLGGTTWEKAKTRVKKAMRDMAEELLKLYAQRQGGARLRLLARHALAGGVRGRVSRTS